jgi:predicted DNA-binding WGR domain protein
LAQHKGELHLSGVAREKVDRSRRCLTAKRLFESEGSDSSKFWDTELRGAELVVRFGRLGTDGQEKIKACPDAAAAATEQAKLIKEKLGKGYKEV